jgi:hypothetical protein
MDFSHKKNLIHFNKSIEMNGGEHLDHLTTSSFVRHLIC